jgi:cyclopropane-fatty-acyl-phospholipid synthase
MTYSSALFEWHGQPLADAQRSKYRALAEKARLRPGEHVLEIGCGWGGFALFAAAEYGCRVTGITISRRQLRMARERVAAAGLRDRVEIRLQDYRDLAGRFDKVVSIEMFEALGQEHWPLFFGKLDEVLAPDGIVALQTISIPDHRFEEYTRHCDWIQKHIFPGGLLASVHHVTGAMIRSSRLNLHHLEDIGVHYALTLSRWRAAFLARVDDVRALGFDERFVRMWDYYLAVCEAMFETRRLGDLQLVFTRQGNASLGGIPAAPPIGAEAVTGATASRRVPAGREEAA